MESRTSEALLSWPSKDSDCATNSATKPVNRRSSSIKVLTAVSSWAVSLVASRRRLRSKVMFLSFKKRSGTCKPDGRCPYYRTIVKEGFKALNRLEGPPRDPLKAGACSLYVKGGRTPCSGHIVQPRLNVVKIKAKGQRIRTKYNGVDERIHEHVTAIFVRLRRAATRFDQLQVISRRKTA
jgi:hypothetical protein